MDFRTISRIMSAVCFLYLICYNQIHNQIHCVNSVQTWRFFWSMFSCIWNEYGGLLCKSLNSVQIWKNTDQKKFPYLDTFHSVCTSNIVWFYC